MWRGRLYFRQYIKTKKHKYGIKLYLLCEPNGFVLNQIVYLGSRDAELGGKGCTQKVVKELTRDYFHSGHAVYMDSYYNSLELTQDLLRSKTLVTGTLSLARKGNPLEVVSRKLKKGEIISRLDIRSNFRKTQTLKEVAKALIRTCLERVQLKICPCTREPVVRCTSRTPLHTVALRSTARTSSYTVRSSGGTRRRDLRRLPSTAEPRITRRWRGPAGGRPVTEQ
ncbi:hypothetical protein J437_LFUL001704 [Ladona fulva]|uniref:PiggyBac transposable element-derived protein domain-containing protein n=1 Tax=Ladona fulva TaxID=123851 RepID=A0A8K0K4J0_LADFU|nr:hypothetical protein J437_LFUL001704 [Ladona fulva]